MSFSINSQNIYSGTYQDDYKALEQIDSVDGINKTEAYIIAKVFFLSRISGCGFPDEPDLEKNLWVCKTRIGRAGTPGESIFINKNTGSVMYGDKAEEVTLKELMEIVAIKDKN